MRIAIFAVNNGFLGAIRRELSQHHQVKEFEATNNDMFNLANILRLVDWCDVIFCDFLQYPATVITSLDCLNKPIVARGHGIELFKDFDGDLNAIDTLILSPAAKDIFLQMLQAKQKAIKIRHFLELTPGCDSDFFTFSPLKAQKEFGRKIVIQSTYMRTEKRIYTAVQLFKELLDLKLEDWTLHIVSDWFMPQGTDVRQERYAWSIQELIDDLGLRENIKVHRFMPREKWRDFLMDKDVFWSLSSSETFSASLMEAMATGMYPVISCWHGAKKYYPDVCIHQTLGGILKATINWSTLSPNQQLQAAQEMRQIAVIYDEKKVALKIREAIEKVGQ